MGYYDDLKRKSALRSQYIPTAEVPPVRTSNIDPVEEMRKRAAARTAAPSGSVRPGAYPSTAGLSVTEQPLPGPTRGDQLAAESLAREQAASRAASRAAYAAPSAPNSVAAKTAEIASNGTSKLRAGLGAVGRAAGTAGGAVALGLEANNVMNAADPMAEAPRAGGRLAAGYAGMKAGARAPGALRIPGAILGGAAGYALGDDAVDAISGNGSVARGQAAAPGSAPMFGNGLVPVLPQGYGSGGGGQGATFDGVQSRVTTPGDRVVGTFNGRPITADQAQAMAGNQSFGGPTTSQGEDIISPLRRMMDGQAFQPSVGMLNSRQGDINRQFDGISKMIQDLHGGAKFQARGSLATKLLRLEEARADALGRDQSNLVGSQGNVVGDNINIRNARLGAAGTLADMQNNDLDNATSMRNNDAAVRGSLLREQLENIRYADKAQREDLQRGEDALFSNIKELFPQDKEGNPLQGFRPDQVLSYIAKTNPKFGEDSTAVSSSLAAMPQAERLEFLASVRAQMQAGEAANQTRGLRGNADSAAQITGVYADDTSLLDIPDLYWNGGQSAGSILRHTVNPFASDRVLTLDNGQTVYEDDAAADDAYNARVNDANAKRKKKDE